MVAEALDQLAACSKCSLDHHWVTATVEVMGEPSRYDNTRDLLVLEASQPVLPASCLQTDQQQAQNTGMAPLSKGLECARHCSTGSTCTE